MGANRMPSLLVPSRWKKNSSTRMAQDIPMTPAATQGLQAFRLAAHQTFLSVPSWYGMKPMHESKSSRIRIISEMWLMRSTYG